MDEKIQKTILIYLAFIVFCVIAGIALSIFSGPPYKPGKVSDSATVEVAAP